MAFDLVLMEAKKLAIHSYASVSGGSNYSYCKLKTLYNFCLALLYASDCVREVLAYIVV